MKCHENLKKIGTLVEYIYRNGYLLRSQDKTDHEKSVYEKVSKNLTIEQN